MLASPSQEITLERGMADYVEHHGIHHVEASRKKVALVFRTFKSYLEDIRGKTAPLLGSIDARDIEIYQAYLVGDRGRSRATANCHYRTLKAFFRWCVLHDLIAKAPTARVLRLREVRRIPRVLRDDEIQKLLTYLDEHRVRYTDLARFILNMGLRLGEALFLQDKDVHWDKGLLHVANKPEHLLKDKQDRLLRLNDRALEILRRRRSLDREAYLFGSRKGTPLNLKTASGRFKRFARLAGVPDANFQTLRKTCLTRCAEFMAPIVLMAFAGHSDVKTTDEYYIARDALRMPPPPAIG